MNELTVDRSKKFYRGAINNIVWIILVVCILGFSFLIDGFFSIGNYLNILRHAVFIGILAIGESYVLMTGNIDLSVEATTALTAMISGWLAASSTYASGLNLNPYLVLIICIVVGAIVGLFNGFFIINLKIHSFLVTLATFFMMKGVAVLITKGRGVSGLPDSFRIVETVKVFGIPLVVFVMIGLFIIFHFVLENTKFGRHIFIIGGNVNAAYNFGINVKGVLYKVFMLSGILAGIAGWLLVARSNGAAYSMGNGLLFQVIAAVVIGGVSLTGGSGRITGVFAGVLILTSIHSALNISSVSPYVTQVVRGALVLFAISLDSLKRLFK